MRPLNERKRSQYGLKDIGGPVVKLLGLVVILIIVLAVVLVVLR